MIVGKDLMRGKLTTGVQLLGLIHPVRMHLNRQVDGDRKKAQWYTFWEAVLVPVLTVVFGFIQSISRIVSFD